MSIQTVLTSERVKAVFRDCLFRDREDTSKCIKAEGIITVAWFHPERLNVHRTEIEEMLNELPGEFKKSDGGGCSFLNACKDKRGNQWTGYHEVVEQLFQLGIGINKVHCQMPRSMWPGLPGGMPYYVID